MSLHIGSGSITLVSSDGYTLQDSAGQYLTLIEKLKIILDGVVYRLNVHSAASNVKEGG